MDLQDFNSEMLYFQEESQPEVEQMVAQAARQYGPESEGILRRALTLAPSSLIVLVGLYRFYYYQHRYEQALEIAHRVMACVGRRISWPESWQDITQTDIVNGVVQSFSLVRLYLFALKAAGYLHLRMANFETGKAMIEKVVAMDSKDRLGAKLLLEILAQNQAEVIEFPGRQTMEACV